MFCREANRQKTGIPFFFFIFSSLISFSPKEFLCQRGILRRHYDFLHTVVWITENLSGWDSWVICVCVSVCACVCMRVLANVPTASPGSIAWLGKTYPAATLNSSYCQWIRDPGVTYALGSK